MASILEFPRYPTAGNIKYTRTMRLRPNTVRLIRKNLGVVVVHGIDYNGNGNYDARSAEATSIPRSRARPPRPRCAASSWPAAKEQQSAQAPGGGRVYTASMGLPPGTPGLICHLRGFGSTRHELSGRASGG